MTETAGNIGAGAADTVKTIVQGACDIANTALESTTEAISNVMQGAAGSYDGPPTD